MRLLSHKMAGFNHLTGPFELALGDLPLGLVAMVGGNGEGKSSIGLEGAFAGLYGPGAQTRAFPSREGTLASYATSRTAYIDDAWDLGSVGTFRVRVNVDGTRRTTDAVLLQVTPDGREMPLNDGKTSTFRTAVSERFPSQRSLLASAFAGQTRRGSFGELGQKERMELFVELADLAYLETKAATARECVRIAESVAVRIRAALDVLQRDVTPERIAELTQRFAQISVEIEASSRQLTDSVNRLTAADRQRQDWQALASQHAAIVVKVDGLRQALARVEAELTSLDPAALQRAHSAMLDQIDARHASTTTGVRNRRQGLTTAYLAATADREERIRNNQTLLAEAETIRAAVTKTQAAEAELVECRRQQDDVRQRHEVAKEQIRVRQAELVKSEQAVKELEAVTRRAELLGTVKFGDACGIDPVCPLVTDAVSARARIPELEGQAQHAPTLRDGIAHWTAEATWHAEDLVALCAKGGELDAQITALAPFVKRAVYLDAADGRILEYRRDAQAAEASHKAALDGLAAEERQADETRAADIQVASDGIQRQALDLEAKRLTLGDEIGLARQRVLDATTEAERTAGAAQSLAVVEQQIGALRIAIAEIERTGTKLQVEREHAEWQQQELSARQAQAEDAARRLRIVEDELLAWQTLAKALGRDGLQRLEIDAAGPVVSDLANQLLEVGYGTRFQIQIVTEVATASGKDTKEKFTVECLDQLHGGEPRDLGDLSGGERVIVEEALRAALSAYVNLRSRQPIRTLFRDECTGALSPENVGPYIALLRKLRELSGVEQILFVTHSVEAAELADAVVEIEGGCVKAIRRAA